MLRGTTARSLPAIHRPSRTLSLSSDCSTLPAEPRNAGLPARNHRVYLAFGACVDSLDATEGAHDPTATACARAIGADVRAERRDCEVHPMIFASADLIFSVRPPTIYGFSTF